MFAVSLLVKIPLFLAFLVFLIAWLVAAIFSVLRLIQGLQSTSTAGFLFTSALPIDLVGLVGLLGTLGITALFFDLGIAALLLLGIALGYLLIFVSWEVLGPLDRPFGSRVLWASARLARNKPLQKVNTIVGSVLILGVVVALSYFFFTEEIPSRHATQRILQVLLIYLVVGFVITVLPQRLAQLVSMNADEDVRTRMLLLQLGGLFAWILYISLLAWSFGIGGEGVALPGSGVDATISLAVVLMIVALFAATSLLPYLLGWRRARWWRQRLLQHERASVDRLVGILKAPSEAGFEDELARLQEEVVSEYDKLLERDPMVRLAVDWEGVRSAAELDAADQFIYEAYLEARESDPRLKHVKFLRKFYEEVGAIAEDLAASKRKDARRRKAESHIGYYNDVRRRIDADFAEDTGRNWVWAGGSLVVLPVMGGVLSKVGERVWQIVEKTPSG